MLLFTNIETFKEIIDIANCDAINAACKNVFMKNTDKEVIY